MKLMLEHGSNLKRNLWIIGLGFFFQGFVLWYAVEKLFFRSEIEMTYEQIGYIGAAATVAILLFEFPSGILADRWSRKGTMVLASLFLAIGAIIFGLSNSFEMILIGTVFWGFYYACQTGTPEALLYDKLKEFKQSDKFEKYLALVLKSQGIALALSSLASGFIADVFNFRLNYWLSLIPLFLSIILFLFIKEPKQHELEANSFKHAKKALKNALVGLELKIISLAIITIVVLFHLIYEYAQLYYIAVDMSTSLYGVAGFLLTLTFTIGAYFALFLRKINKDYLYLSTVLLFVIFVTGMYFVRSNWAMVQIFLVALLLQAFNTFVERELQDRIPSAERAATGSLLGSLGRLFSIPFSLAVGFVTQKYDFFANVPIYVFPSIVLGILLVFIIQKRHSLKPKLAIGQPLHD